MTSILIKHKVENYEKWKAEFDAFKDQRKQGGEKSYQIYRPVDDPDNLTILFEWESEDTAKTFLGSVELREAMQRAGVSQDPEISVMNRIDQGNF